MIANALVVGLGGFVGAVARYGLSAWVQRQTTGGFPLGTLSVNLLGCLLIGCVVHLGVDRTSLSPQAKLFLMAGILGGFTTFSAFGYETLEQLRAGAIGPAMLNAAANVVLGVGAVWAGRALMRAVGA